MIVTLGSWVYSEYVNNAYFQTYVNSFSPILVPIVSVGFGIASATVAILLYFTMRNIRRRELLRDDGLSRRRGPAKKTTKKPQVASMKGERTAAGGLPMLSKAKALTAGASSSKRGTARESSTEEGESD